MLEKPGEERRELELIYRAKGLDRETAKRTAESIMADPEVALDTLAREELGLDPDELKKKNQPPLPAPPPVMVPHVAKTGVKISRVLDQH
ncbi:MAG TPA: hypothetical protein EYQ84_08490, partial [Nitrospinaceae bacterium]|nr:hypothetical protein [Nitrospinaceae bacterium]